ncbi:hypothetical protein L0F63_002816 [Massospora cicadina]|nr:hypothetical protein L0F63_002816 [Massospora cicadina]
MAWLYIRSMFISVRGFLHRFIDEGGDRVTLIAFLKGDDALLNFQMLEALRKGGEHQGQHDHPASPRGYMRQLRNEPVSNFRLDPSYVNAQDSREYPLHLATRSGRADITNTAGKAAKEIAKTHELQAAFQGVYRRKAQFLNHHLAQPTPANVHAIANHGLTCLHQAAVLGDEELVSQLLRLGANVFSRYKRGLAPIDQLTPSSVVAVDPNRLPRLEGQLKSGPITLGGFLSYYCNQEDTANACHGSINLAHDKSCKDQTKFHLWAAMLDEAKRWIVAITQAKQYLQRFQASPEMPAAVGATMNSPQGPPTVENARSCTNSVNSLELLPSQEGLVMASTLPLCNLIFRSCFSIS